MIMIAQQRTHKSYAQYKKSNVTNEHFDGVHYLLMPQLTFSQFTKVK